MEIIAPVVEEVSAQVWNDTNWSSPLLTYLKNIIEKKVQGQTPDSELIWVLFLNKHGKKMNYPTAEQRGINRNIHNRPKGRGINKPQAYETPVRPVYGGLVRLRRIKI